MIKKIFLILILCNLFTSCYYSFKGKGMPGIESITISQFEDRTAEFQIREKLESQLIQTFQQENVFKIRPAESADATLNGIILSVRDVPRAIGKNEVASQTEVSVNVQITLIQKATGKKLFSQNFTALALYTDISNRDVAIEKAIDELTRNIADRIVSDW